jgi:hypothetical protein
MGSNNPIILIDSQMEGEVGWIMEDTVNVTPEAFGEIEGA